MLVGEGEISRGEAQSRLAARGAHHSEGGPMVGPRIVGGQIVGGHYSERGSHYSEVEFLTSHQAVNSHQVTEDMENLNICIQPRLQQNKNLYKKNCVNCTKNLICNKIA